MAQKVDYAALKKGGYMRQKQKGYGSLRLAVIGGNLTAENIKKRGGSSRKKYGRGICTYDFPSGNRDSVYQSGRTCRG